MSRRNNKKSTTSLPDSPAQNSSLPIPRGTANRIKGNREINRESKSKEEEKKQRTTFTSSNEISDNSNDENVRDCMICDYSIDINDLFNCPHCNIMWCKECISRHLKTHGTCTNCKEKIEFPKLKPNYQLIRDAEERRNK